MTVALSMMKARSNKLMRGDDGGRASADALDIAGYTPPPKKPPAPSLKHPLKGAREVKRLIRNHL
jgi:hypothetical protein